MALQAHVLDAVHTGTETFRERGRPMWSALDAPVAASDGFLVVRADEEGLVRLCGLCGVERDGRSWHQAEAEVANRMAGRPVADWGERLAGCGIAWAPVATDLAAVPDDARMAPLFEPLGTTGRAPASPWSMEP
jgi:hypothetical protein